MTIKSKLIAVLHPVLHHHHHPPQDDDGLSLQKKTRRRFSSTFVTPSLIMRTRKATVTAKDVPHPYGSPVVAMAHDKLPPSPSTSSILSLPCPDEADASLPPSPSLTPISCRLPKPINLPPIASLPKAADEDQVALLSFWLICHIGLQLLVGLAYEPAPQVEVPVERQSIDIEDHAGVTPATPAPTSELLRLLKAPCFAGMAHDGLLQEMADHDQHMATYWRSRPTSRRARRHAAATDEGQDPNDDQAPVMHPAVLRLAQGALDYLRTHAAVTDQLQQLQPRMEQCVRQATLHANSI